MKNRIKRAFQSRQLFFDPSLFVYQLLIDLYLHFQILIWISDITHTRTNYLLQGGKVLSSAVKLISSLLEKLFEVLARVLGNNIHLLDLVLKSR